MSGFTICLNESDFRGICPQFNGADTESSQLICIEEDCYFLSDVDYDNLKYLCETGQRMVPFEFQGHDIVSTLKQMPAPREPYSDPEKGYPEANKRGVINKIYESGNSISSENEIRLNNYLAMAESMGALGMVNAAIDNLKKKRPEKVTLEGLIGHVLAIISLVYYKRGLESIGLKQNNSELKNSNVPVDFVDDALRLLVSGRVCVKIADEKKMNRSAEYESDENVIILPDSLTPPNRPFYQQDFRVKGRAVGTPLFASIVHEAYHMVSDYRKDIRLLKTEEANATFNQYLVLQLYGIDSPQNSHMKVDDSHKLLLEHFMNEGSNVRRMVKEMKKNIDDEGLAEECAKFFISRVKSGKNISAIEFRNEFERRMSDIGDAYENIRAISLADYYLMSANKEYNSTLAVGKGPREYKMDLLQTEGDIFNVATVVYPTKFESLSLWVDSEAEAARLYFGKILERPFNEWPEQYRLDYKTERPYRHLKKVVIPIYSLYLAGLFAQRRISEAEAFIERYYLPAIRAYVGIGNTGNYNGISE